MNQQRSKDKSPFRSVAPLRTFSSNEHILLNRICAIASGKINEGIIGILPGTHETLSIDTYKIRDIRNKHGKIPLENLLITANAPSCIVKGVADTLPYVTLIYEFIGGGFVLSSRKFNGHYIVTFFESLDSKYIESIKNRGEIVTIKE